MKEIINADGIAVYEFEDRETAEKFQLAMSRSNAERYVIDRMIDGISQSVLKDLLSGSLSPADARGLDVDSPGNVLKVAVKFLANLVFETANTQNDGWALAHAHGLPDDGSNWNFNHSTQQFSRIERADEENPA